MERSPSWHMDLEKDSLPPYSAAIADTGDGPVGQTRWSRRWLVSRTRRRRLRLIGVACLLAFCAYTQWRQTHLLPGKKTSNSDVTAYGLSVKQLHTDLLTCSTRDTKPVDSVGSAREKNDRYVEGHKPTLIRNATVWVGEPASAESGHYSWIAADVFLEHGLIKQVGKDLQLHGLQPGRDLLVYDAAGRPLTSGLIDMHSHAGVHGLPTLHSNDDVSELSTNIAPFVRSIDGIQPTDAHLRVIKSGGVTTSLILPGSGNNIGGEAFVVKHAVGPRDGRPEISVEDMLVDHRGSDGQSWRHVKMACGENPKHVHGKAGERGPISRLGESWEFRRAFEKAAKLRRAQDDWCRTASTLGLDAVRTYLPVEREWEMLVAVLRGQVHVHVHCYTIPDLEAFVDHTNEFNFSVRAFHHAHQSYLVPEVSSTKQGAGKG